MTSSLTDKIINALASSSSTCHIEESTLTSLGKKQEILNALKQLLDDRKIVSCTITKNGHTANVYWLACQVVKPRHYSEIFTPEKRLEREAAKKIKAIVKKEIERYCKLCLATKPITAYKGRSTRCDGCLKELRIQKYKLLTSRNEKEKSRWCMACKKNHPATEFGNTRSRRCSASMLVYQQNKRSILAEKNRVWRAKKKAVQTNNSLANEG